jgi:hypothetical protein
MAKIKKTTANGKDSDKARVDLREVFETWEPNPFKTKDPEAFKQFLGEAGIVDLQQMAVEAGVSASGGIPTLRENLQKAFSRYIAPRSVTSVPSSIDYQKQKELAAKIDAIMAGN